MSQKTLILIVALVLITLGLIAFAVQPIKQKPVVTPQQTTNVAQPPVVLGHTILTFSPNPLTVSSTASSIEVNVDSAGDRLTGVQLELSYDPQILTNVTVKGGTFFEDPMELIKVVNQTKGTVNYTIVTSISKGAKAGSGTVAIITFDVLKKPAGGTTTIKVLPTTIVTAIDQANTVLKQTTDLTINF